MKKALITFTKCIQDSQEYGSNDDIMVSRLFLSLSINGKEYPNLHCNIKQIPGSDIENSPIEVSNPIGYKGPFNYEEFRKTAEIYYRSLVGKGGSGIHIGGGARNIRMYNNIFAKSMTFEFNVDEGSGGW